MKLYLVSVLSLALFNVFASITAFDITPLTFLGSDFSQYQCYTITSYNNRSPGKTICPTLGEKEFSIIRNSFIEQIDDRIQAINELEATKAPFQEALIAIANEYQHLPKVADFYMSLYHNVDEALNHAIKNFSDNRGYRYDKNLIQINSIDEIKSIIALDSSYLHHLNRFEKQLNKATSAEEYIEIFQKETSFTSLLIQDARKIFTAGAFLRRFKAREERPYPFGHLFNQLTVDKSCNKLKDEFLPHFNLQVQEAFAVSYNKARISPIDDVQSIVKILSGGPRGSSLIIKCKKTKKRYAHIASYIPDVNELTINYHIDSHIRFNGLSGLLQNNLFDRRKMLTITPKEELIRLLKKL